MPRCSIATEWRTSELLLSLAYYCSLQLLGFIASVSAFETWASCHCSICSTLCICKSRVSSYMSGHLSSLHCLSLHLIGSGHTKHTHLKQANYGRHEKYVSTLLQHNLARTATQLCLDFATTSLELWHNLINDIVQVHCCVIAMKGKVS